RRLTCQLNEDQTPSTPKKQKNVMEKMTMRKKEVRKALFTLEGKETNNDETPNEVEENQYEEPPTQSTTTEPKDTAKGATATTVSSQRKVTTMRRRRAGLRKAKLPGRRFRQASGPNTGSCSWLC